MSGRICTATHTEQSSSCGLAGAAMPSLASPAACMAVTASLLSATPGRVAGSAAPVFTSKAVHYAIEFQLLGSSRARWMAHEREEIRALPVAQRGPYIFDDRKW